MNPKVDWYFTKNNEWKEEIEAMRAIALGCGLREELKWGCPCYTLNGSNVVLIHCFKGYCAFLFFKGALLKDPAKILIQQTKNVQAARQIRFTDVKEILRLKSTLKSCIKEAAEIERKGLKVKLKETGELEVPEEFRSKLKEIPELKRAFGSLTPGRQRGYLLYFSSAKQSATRESRIRKHIPQILKGKGLND